MKTGQAILLNFELSESIRYNHLLSKAAACLIPAKNIIHPETFKRIEIEFNQKYWLKSPIALHELINNNVVGFVVALANAESFRNSNSNSEFLILDGKAWSLDLAKGLEFQIEHNNRLSYCTKIDNHLIGKGINTIWEDVIIESPKSINNIIIDTKSPIAKHIVTEKKGFQQLPNLLLPVFITKLNRVLNQIEILHPQLYNALTRYVHLIVPGEVPLERRTRIVRHGASNPLFPGTIFMNDYHRKEISDAELAENIIHEFTHNFLFELERNHTWYQNDKSNTINEGVKPSLWSDRTLPFYSFFHSLIVFSTVHDWTCVTDKWPKKDFDSHNFLSNRKKELLEGFAKLKGKLSDNWLDNNGPLSELGLQLVNKMVVPKMELS